MNRETFNPSYTLPKLNLPHLQRRAWEKHQDLLHLSMRSFNAYIGNPADVSRPSAREPDGQSVLSHTLDAERCRP